MLVYLAELLALPIADLLTKGKKATSDAGEKASLYYNAYG